MDKTALVALSAFNLICNGTSTLRSLLPDKIEPYESIFRIDLDSKRWCQGDCKETRSIVEVSQTEIVLDRHYDNSSQFTDKISRESGRESYMMRIENFAQSGSPILLTREGTCSVAPFTSFPTNRF